MYVHNFMIHKLVLFSSSLIYHYKLENLVFRIIYGFLNTYFVKQRVSWVCTDREFSNIFLYGV